jgi:hypothetical protein
VSPKTADAPPPPSVPAWRRLVDRFDGLVTPSANAFVRTSLFADGIAGVTRLEVQIRRRAERQTTMVLHLFNLPTAGDIKRVRRQLAAVEARLRALAEQLEDQAEHRQ